MDLTRAGRRAGLVGLTAGAVAAAAAVGVAAERSGIGRRLREEIEPRLALRASISGGDVRNVAPQGAHRGREVVVVADDGVLLHAEVDEPKGGPRSGRPTIVLCHGYGLSLESWVFQRQDLTDLGTVVLYDQRGHGMSGRGDRDRATIDQLGNDLHAVIGELAPEGPLVLVGHSMGGMTVMALAEHHPELFGARVIGVALCATSPGKLAEVMFGIPTAGGRLLRRVAPPLFDQLARRPELVARGRRVASDVELLLTRRFSFASRVSPDLVAFTSRMISTTPVDTIADFWPAFDSHDRLAALDVLRGVEVLVIGGDQDRLTPADHSREIATALPEARLCVVEPAGHLVMLEHPTVVSAELRELVQRAVARAAGGAAAARDAR